MNLKLKKKIMFMAMICVLESLVKIFEEDGKSLKFVLLQTILELLLYLRKYPNHKARSLLEHACDVLHEAWMLSEYFSIEHDATLSACQHFSQVLMDVLMSKPMVSRSGTKEHKKISSRGKLMVSWRITRTMMFLRNLSILEAFLC